MYRTTRSQTKSKIESGEGLNATSDLSDSKHQAALLQGIRNEAVITEIKQSRKCENLSGKFNLFKSATNCEM